MFHWTHAVLHSGPQILGANFTWMRWYANHPEKYDIRKKYEHLSKLIRNLCRNFRMDLIVDGADKLPKGTPICLTPNHLADFDPLPFFCVLDEPTTFVAKKEVEKFPFVGLCVKDVEGCFIDRNDLKQSLKTMLQVQNDFEKKSDKNWIIFPEGTRNRDPMSPLREFHHGTFRAPMKAGVPIVPVAIYGTFRPLKMKPQFRRYPIFIKILDPLYAEDYKDMTTKEVAAYVQYRVQQAITFDLRARDHEYMMKHNKGKAYRFNWIY